MPVTWLVFILVALALVGFVAGRARAFSSAGGDARNLHSLPGYYGYNVALTALVPALGVLIIWLLAQPMIIERSVSGMIPEASIPASRARARARSAHLSARENLSNRLARSRVEPPLSVSEGS